MKVTDKVKVNSHHLTVCLEHISELYKIVEELKAEVANLKSELK